MYDYDIRDGIRLNDTVAMSFEYDSRPLVPGEAGAGTLVDTDDNMMDPADWKYMDALNAFRVSKGWNAFTVPEYLAHMSR